MPETHINLSSHVDNPTNIATMIKPHFVRWHTAHISQMFSPEVLVLLVPAAAKLLIHLLGINGYGIHGDELYYLACSDHLDWGYVDHPALSIFLLHLERALFGDSASSIRLLPAFAGALSVLLAGLLARRMGAGLFGQLLAGLCALAAPVYLAVHHYYSMNAFDVLFWTGALYLIVRIIDGGKPTLWVWFGIVMGAGFENKVGVLFLGFGLVVGLLMTKQRRLLLDRWAWLGALVAILLMLPYILWQIPLGWPTLEWIGNARAYKMVALSPAAFLKEQVFLLHPLTLLVWGTGLVALLVHPSFTRYRSLGWCYLAILVVFILQGGKPYYLAAIYPLLFATGSIAVERWLIRPWLRTAAVAALVLSGALLAPLGMPLLSPERFLQYQDVIGMRPNLGEKWAEGRMPSFLASFFGWNELAAMVDTVFRSLPAEDQAKCGVFGRNYMQAGAIDFYLGKSGGPHAIAGHNNYWLWGMRGYTGEVMIVLGGSVEELKQTFEEVSERARFRNVYMQPMHSDISIFVVRKLKRPLEQIWPSTKLYI